MGGQAADETRSIVVVAGKESSTVYVLFVNFQDFKADSSQLDYIQGMGFTAIWITPVTEQLPQDTGDGEAYHGYWQQKM